MSEVLVPGAENGNTSGNYFSGECFQQPFDYTAELTNFVRTNLCDDFDFSTPKFQLQTHQSEQANRYSSDNFSPLPSTSKQRSRKPLKATPMYTRAFGNPGKKNLYWKSEGNSPDVGHQTFDFSATSSPNTNEPDFHNPQSLSERRRFSCELIEPLRLRISTASQQLAADYNAISEPSNQTDQPSSSQLLFQFNEQLCNFPLLSPHLSAQWAAYLRSDQLPSTQNSEGPPQKLARMSCSEGVKEEVDKRIDQHIAEFSRGECSTSRFDYNLEEEEETDEDEVAVIEMQKPASRLTHPNKLVPAAKYLGEVVTLSDDEDESYEKEMSRYSPTSCGPWTPSSPCYSPSASPRESPASPDESPASPESSSAMEVIKDQCLQLFHQKEELQKKLKKESDSKLSLTTECGELRKKLYNTEMQLIHTQDRADESEPLRAELRQMREEEKDRLGELDRIRRAKLVAELKVEQLKQQVKQLEEDKERQSREQCCIICLDAKREILFMPCLHFNTCEACSQQGAMTHCSTCRQMIMGKVKVYQ